MNSSNFKGILFNRTAMYMWVISVLVLVITLLMWQIGVFAILLLAFLIFYNIRANSARVKEITHYIENLTFDIDNVTKDTLLNFPLPLVFMELDGNIVWYNSLFKKIFEGEELLEYSISNFVEEMHPEKLQSENGSINRQISVKGKQYNVLGNFVKASGQNEKPNIILMAYLIDNTELFEYKQKYVEEKPVISCLIIDNYDELMSGLEDTGRPMILAEIDKRVNAWATVSGGIVRKFERDKYLFIFRSQFLKYFEDKKFEILDSVKEINIGNKIPVTLSMGVSANAATFGEGFVQAIACIDIALGRGGDQVVLKNGENTCFYGGKTRELEKRTKVKARVVANALREIIHQSSQVMIMGHENSDIDAMGAALGLYRVARELGKQANIVMESTNAGLMNLLSRLDKEPEYNGLFLSRNEALTQVDRSTLLIVVDTHRPSFTECPELLKLCGQIVVIDHHRRGSEYINDAVLAYHETYASSASELVTEILQYVSEKLKLTRLEAEALYAGIVIDTKHFTFKTGVRTFEAASYLRRQGVDTVAVRQFFQNDLHTYITRSDIVRNSEIIKDGIAISVCPSGVKNAPLISAQAADELLDLAGINAAFVLSEDNGQILISGRSLGDINVQVILEKLGGGGHLTVAGAQLETTDMEDARQRLKSAIVAFFDESN